MNQETRNEIWQVEVGGKIYEAPLAELPDWIGEGSLLPADKVRKGNLRWIEARKVPALIPFFNAREKGEPMPVVQSVTDAAEQSEPVAGRMEEPANSIEPATEFHAAETSVSAALETPKPFAPRRTAVPGQCINHEDRATAYICSSCGLELCKVCPSSYGGSVRICPDCGSLCRSVAEAAQKAREAAVDIAISNESFGFADFGRAFVHPFQFKASLIFGGLMYVFFSFGASATSIGGLFLIAAAIICMMLSNMLIFGIRANVIDNFVQGKLDADFMPSFDDFSIWGDVVHPFLLSIGVYISSFGAFFLVAIIGFYLIFSAASEQMKKFNDELTRVPGTPVYAPDRTAEQSKEVRAILDTIKQQNERRTADQQRAAESVETGGVQPEGAVTDSQAADQEKEKLDRLLQEIRTKQLEQAAPTTKTQDKKAQYAAVIASIMHLAAPLVVLGMITFLWGAFYYPAACAVAGYTRSFTATINPLVGLDTIRRLGVDYIKILLMAFLLLIVAGVIGFSLELLLSPFDLPRVGNLPASVLGSFVTFYVSVVFSCILGYALFRSADRLKLHR
jgi:hypothetical protein